MKASIRNLALNLLGNLNSPSPGIHILNGHFVSRETKDPNVFHDLLIKLQNKNVVLSRIEEAVDLITNKKIVKKPIVAFTFDDGFEECYTKIAPVLKSFGINAAFMINPNFIECCDSYKEDFLTKKVFVQDKNPMTWAMVEELKNDGFIIGAHTLDHIRLNIEDEDILTLQIVQCKKVIEEKLNMNCEYFAYPYGQINDISPMALKIAKNYYKYVFTGCNHKKYFSFNESAINRRHFEGDWPLIHMNYFLSFKKKY